MKLSARQLEAFYLASQKLNFSKAAEELKITQSALTQRIQKLEKKLNVSLMIRQPNSVTLTDEGLRLLRYCETINQLEDEVVEELSFNEGKNISGEIRVGCGQSLARSFVLPVLSKILKKQSNVYLNLKVKPLDEVSSMLQKSEVDYLILDRVLEKPGLETYVLGHEKYVVIESTKAISTRDQDFLDFSENEIHTLAFLTRKGERTANVPRHFLNDVYGVIDGVKAGLGRAVVPLHLIKNDRDIKVSMDFEPKLIPVVLIFHSKPFYTKVFDLVLEELTSQASRFLGD